jgi:hypothetical protein
MIEGMVNRTRVPRDDQPKSLPLDNSGKKAILEAARYPLPPSPIPQNQTPRTYPPYVGKIC